LNPLNYNHKCRICTSITLGRGAAARDAFEIGLVQATQRIVLAVLLASVLLFA